MDIKKFKKISKKVEKPDFNEDFKTLNIILRVLSILGNFASIFLASFFITDLLAVAISNTYVVWGVAIIALVGLEMTKRAIFFMFSRDFIRTNKLLSASVAPMLFATLTLISLSFYSSLSGAKEFSSKSKEIENVAEKDIDNYSDSLTTIYNSKILVYEERNVKLFDKNSQYDDQVDKLLEEHPTWVNSAKKIRDSKIPNLEQMVQNDDKIDELKLELKNTIQTYKKDVETDSSESIADNDNDSLIFVGTSTLIEFLILIGIYFNNVYNFRSFRDIKRKINNDDNFRLYYEYSEILNMLYLNKEGSLEKELIPDKKLIKDLLTMNKSFLSDKQIEDALMLFAAINIVEVNEEFTYVIINKTEAEKAVKKHFNI